MQEKKLIKSLPSLRNVIISMTRASSSNPLVSDVGGVKLPATTSFACLLTWLGTRGDYESIERRDKALKGWRRKISPATMEGRFNIVVATWVTSAIAGVYAWHWYKNNKKKEADKSSEK